MTVYNIEYNCTQLRRVKSPDTIIELCLRICVQVTGYLRMQLVDNRNQPGADKIESALTMIQWYFGILNRAAVTDNNYQGNPQVVAIYLEKLATDRLASVKQAFSFATLRKLPDQLLVEVMYVACIETLKVITPSSNISTMNFQQVQKWENKIIGCLTDISIAMGYEPIAADTKLAEVMIKFSVPDNQNMEHDFLG
jgi:hypothetical protein